jgi:hypothetical protein
MPNKRVSKQIGRRMDHKRERAAVRQVLDGGKARQSPNDSWAYRPEPVPIPDDAPSTGCKKTRGCKRNKGGDHAPVLKARYYGTGEYRRVWYDTVCDYCGKHRWGRNTKGWTVKPRPKPERTYYKYAVVSTSGIVCSRFHTERDAQDRCDEANFDAEILDIDERYVVRFIV